MCIFANEGGPKSKSSRKETPLKIQKYKEKHVSVKNLEKMFLAPTPTTQPSASISCWAMNPFHPHQDTVPPDHHNNKVGISWCGGPHVIRNLLQCCLK